MLLLRLLSAKAGVYRTLVDRPSALNDGINEISLVRIRFCRRVAVADRNGRWQKRHNGTILAGRGNGFGIAFANNMEIRAMATHSGECFCGAVHVEVSGDPEGMGYCHCGSCRSWSGGPVNAFTLWKLDAVRITAGVGS